MDIFDFCVIGIVGAVLAVTIKNSRSEFAIMISIATGVVLLVMTAVWLSTFVHEVKETVERYNLPQSYMVTVLKVLGISYISEFSANICKDAGESATASKILLGGRVMIACLTIPVMQQILEKICGVLI